MLETFPKLIHDHYYKLAFGFLNDASKQNSFTDLGTPINRTLVLEYHSHKSSFGLFFTDANAITPFPFTVYGMGNFDIN
jgi:hypothetical protein